MTKIITSNNDIIIEGHANTKEECETITLLCDCLSKDKNFNQIAYDNGYAKFEKVGHTEKLKFAPGTNSLYIYDSITGEEIIFINTDSEVTVTYSANVITFTANSPIDITRANSKYVKTYDSGSSTTLTATLKNDITSLVADTSSNIVSYYVSFISTSITSKTYVINEVFGRSEANINYNINFSLTDGRKFTNIQIDISSFPIGQKIYYINAETGVNELVCADASAMLEDIYRTLIFETSPIGPFADWLQINAKAYKEIWILNSELNTQNDHFFNVAFSSNSENFTSITIDSFLTDMLYNNNQAYQAGVWRNTAYKTLTFPNPVTDKLLVWLKQNGDQQKILEAGTYKWKDKPSNFVDGESDAFEDLPLISNNTNFTGITFTELDPETGEFYELNYIKFTSNTYEPILIYSSETWASDAYKTVTFTKDYVLRPNYYEWLITDGNLVKQFVPNPNAIKASGLLSVQTLVATDDISWLDESDQDFFADLQLDYDRYTFSQLLSSLSVETENFKTTYGTVVDITSYKKLSASLSLLAIDESGHLSLDAPGELTDVTLTSEQLQNMQLNDVNILAIVIDNTGKVYAHELSSINGIAADISILDSLGIVFFVKSTSQTPISNNKIIYANKKISKLYAGTKIVKTIYQGTKIIYNN